MSVASLLAMDSMQLSKHNSVERKFPSLGCKKKSNRVTCPGCGNTFKVSKEIVITHTYICKKCGKRIPTIKTENYYAQTDN
jgi:formylmethanofuran dehydrogenase subunit E